MWFIACNGVRIDGFDSYASAVEWASKNLTGFYTVAEKLLVA